MTEVNNWFTDINIQLLQSNTSKLMQFCTYTREKKVSSKINFLSIVKFYQKIDYQPHIVYLNPFKCPAYLLFHIQRVIFRQKADADV